MPRGPVWYHRCLRSNPLLLVLLAACTGRAPLPPDAVDGGGAAPDTLIVARSIDADVLVQGLQTSIGDLTIVDALTTPLLRADFDCGIRWQPGWARSFEVVGEMVRMDLGEAPRWEDGAPVTADDLAFAHELAIDPAVASKAVLAGQAMIVGQAPLVVGDRLEWHFRRPMLPQLMLLYVDALGVPSRASLGQADRATLRGHPSAVRPPSSGPWRITAWERGERLVLEPNPHAQEPPRLGRIVFRVIPEYATRLLELESGNVDVLEGVLSDDAARLARDHPEIRVHARRAAGVDYVGWNLATPDGSPHPIFGDRDVRRALAAAVDVDGLIGSVFSGDPTQATPAFGTISPNLCRKGPSPARVPFDPAASRAGLEAAGWVDRDGDGVREKGAVRLRFELLTNTGNPRRGQAAVLLQAAFAAVGAEVVLARVEANTFFGRLRRHEFEAALAGWANEPVADLRSKFRSGPGMTWNQVSYANPEVDGLLDLAEVEVDPARRDALLDSLEALIYADQPYLFLYWYDDLVAVHERFRDVRVDAANALGDLHRWWVSAEDAKYVR